jgi:hypothetical protein
VNPQEFFHVFWMSGQIFPCQQGAGESFQVSKLLRAMILFAVSVLSVMLVEFHEGLANPSSSSVESANGGSCKQEIIPWT